MTDLKTLKDLNLDGYSLDNLCELRQEAIKWIKELDKHSSDLMNDIPREERNALIEELTDFDEDSVINFIKYFFNITEEDLK